MAAGKKKPEEKKTDTSGTGRSLRDDAEKQLARSQKPSPASMDKTPEALIHELQVHQIELEIQAEELRNSKIALEESRDTYLDLYDFAPIGYFTISDKALINGVNLTGAKLLGVERSRLVNAPFSKFVAENDAGEWNWYFMNVLNQKEKRTCTLMLKRGGGSMFPARLEAILIIGSDGVNTVRVAIIDVSDIRDREDALQKSEEKYRAIYDQSPIAIELYDAAGTLRHVNPACLDLFGIQDMQAIENFTLFADPNLDNELKKKLRKAETVHYQGPFDFEKVRSLNLYRTSRKGIIWLDVLITPLGNTLDSITGFLVQVQDITGRKVAEALVRESEDRYHSLFDSSIDAILLTAPDGRILEANDAACRMFEQTTEEIRQIGRNGIIDTSDPRLALAIEERNRTGRLQNYELICLRKSGRKFPAEITSAVFNDKEGNARTSMIIRDITENKRTKDALTTSEQKYRALFAAESDGIFVVDKESGIIIDCNDAITPIYDYQKDEVIGKLNTFVSAEPDATRAATQEVKGCIPIRYHKRKNGEVFPVEITANVISVQGRDLIIAAVRDITERKNAEEALNQANKKLKLLSGITRHDINNQLTVLMGFLSLLKKKQTDTTLNEYFVKVATAAQRISSMIQFTKEYENIGVKAPVWQDCCTLADTAAKDAPLGNVVVKNDLPAGAEVFADPLVVKVFYNLMDNAVRYGGKITTIRFSVEERDGDRIVVCEDDGDGVVAEEKEKIFKRGFGKNTGLGLAISREILLITGITIKETGEPGKGARFEMTVPNGMWRSAGKEA